jgi:hypothetical protein
MIRFAMIGMLLAAPFLSAAAVNAQSRMTIDPSPPRGDQVRVQINVSFVLPGVPGDGDEAVKAQENARRMLYRIADRECAVLKETIASDCRLESVNVNVNRFRNQNADTLNAGANMTFRIQIK